MLIPQKEKKKSGPLAKQLKWIEAGSVPAEQAIGHMLQNPKKRTSQSSLGQVKPNPMEEGDRKTDTKTRAGDFPDNFFTKKKVPARQETAKQTSLLTAQLTAIRQSNLQQTPPPLKQLASEELELEDSSSTELTDSFSLSLNSNS